MGTVFRADQISLGRTVAVKLLNASLRATRGWSRASGRGARGEPGKHPNTISIIDFGQTPDRLLYLVMEFVRGRTLTEVIRPRFPIRPARLVDIMCQLLAGLHEATPRVSSTRTSSRTTSSSSGCGPGVTWRRSRLRIARLRDDPAAGDHTISGTRTTWHPSRSAARASTSGSDVYAAGVVLYEMLTSERPFGGGQQEILRAHLSTLPVPPRLRRPDVANRARDRSRRAPRDGEARTTRFESALALRQALERALERSGSGPVCRQCGSIVPPSSLYCRAAAEARDAAGRATSRGSAHATEATLARTRRAMRPHRELPAMLRRTRRGGDADRADAERPRAAEATIVVGAPGGQDAPVRRGGRERACGRLPRAHLRRRSDRRRLHVVPGAPRCGAPRATAN